MTNALQQTRYDRLIRRVGGIIGPGSKVGEVIPELFPMIDVEQVPMELLVLAGTNSAGASSNQAGVAAVVQQSQLFNPPDSGKIATITSMFIRAETTQQIQYGLVTVALAGNPDTARFLDGRLGVTGSPACQIHDGNSGTIAPTVVRVFVLADQFVHVNIPKGCAVLSPGVGIQVTTTTINTALTCSFLWTERVGERSEFLL